MTNDIHEPTIHSVFATAGHVDHGKSSLIKALSGIDPDRLPIEKKRGITVDLGFAGLQLTHPSTPQRVELGIVDVPGHKDYVANMASGLSGIKFALVVIAANEGWMPQTTEHLEILHFLGIHRILIALTKTDLVKNEESLRRVTESIEEKLLPFGVRGAPILPCSAKTLQGITPLRECLANFAVAIGPSEDIGEALLEIDRVFLLKGLGSVVTGTLQRGSLEEGMAVKVQPGANAYRIRSLQSQGLAIKAAIPGQRVAINLNSIGSSENSLERGQTITLSNKLQSCRQFDAILVSRPGGRREHESVLTHGNKAKLHLHASKTNVRVFLHPTAPMRPGEQRIVHIECESPVTPLIGQYFILRNWSETRTLAGGQIMEIDTTRTTFRRPSHQAFLQTLMAVDISPESYLHARLLSQPSIKKGDLPLFLNDGDDQTALAIQNLIHQGLLIQRADWLISKSNWQRWMDKAKNIIESFHRQHPEKRGINILTLIEQFRDEAETDDFTSSLSDWLSDEGYAVNKGVVASPQFKPALPEPLREAGEQIKQRLSVKPLDPASLASAELSKAQVSALRYLIENDEVRQLTDNVYLMSWAYRRLQKMVVKHLEETGNATVSQLRLRLNTSRRIIIPLLEAFDREGLTERVDDQRRLFR